jgi:HEAT repeat protein
MCQVLARVGPPVVPQLLPRLEDTRWYVVRNIVYILGRVGQEATFIAVIPLLDHSHPRVRVEAIRALALIGGANSITPLLRSAGDPDPAVRRATVKALGSLKSDAAVPALRELLDQPGAAGADLEMTQEVIGALAAIGSPAARGALDRVATRRVWFWQRADRRVRSMAAEALGGRTAAPESRGADDGR